jgi:hypothetical protein
MSALKRTIVRFSAARSDWKAVETAIKRYLEEGDALEMPPYELHDYFHISSLGLLQQAGFANTEVEDGSEVFNAVVSERYGA